MKGMLLRPLIRDADRLVIECRTDEEIKRARDSIAAHIVARAAPGTLHCSVYPRVPNGPLWAQAGRRGWKVWDVWNRVQDGGGPQSPNGRCFGSVIVDRSEYLENGGPIKVYQCQDEHIKALEKQLKTPILKH